MVGDFAQSVGGTRFVGFEDRDQHAHYAEDPAQAAGPLLHLELDLRIEFGEAERCGFDKGDGRFVETAGFKEAVSASLRRQVNAINRLAARGMHWWDYGNSFLLEASRAGADVDDERGAYCRKREEKPAI